MPVSKNALFRFICIDKILRKHNFSSLKAIQLSVTNELKEAELGEGISINSIKKDVENMRNLFGAPIDFDKINSGYFYTISDYSFLTLGTSQLEAISNNIKINLIYKSSADLLNYIEFETQTNADNFSDLVIPIAHALKKRFEITFEYSHMKDGKNEKIKLKPFYLKENRNYWYLVGTDKLEKKCIFNIHRISNLKISPTKFDEDLRTRKEIKQLFKNVIGISTQFRQADKIILEIQNKQMNYLIEKPLHWSQKVISSDKKFTQFELELEINYELIANILSYGDMIRVISPLLLRKTVSEKLKNALKNYDG